MNPKPSPPVRTSSFAAHGRSAGSGPALWPPTARAKSLAQLQALAGLELLAKGKHLGTGRSGASSP